MITNILVRKKKKKKFCLLKRDFLTGSISGVIFVYSHNLAKKKMRKALMVLCLRNFITCVLDSPVCSNAHSCDLSKAVPSGCWNWNTHCRQSFTLQSCTLHPCSIIINKQVSLHKMRNVEKKEKKEKWQQNQKLLGSDIFSPVASHVRLKLDFSARLHARRDDGVKFFLERKNISRCDGFS